MNITYYLGVCLHIEYNIHLNSTGNIHYLSPRAKHAQPVLGEMRKPAAVGTAASPSSIPSPHCMKHFPASGERLLLPSEALGDFIYEGSVPLASRPHTILQT